MTFQRQRRCEAALVTWLFVVRNDWRFFVWFSTKASEMPPAGNNEDRESQCLVIFKTLLIELALTVRRLVNCWGLRGAKGKSLLHIVHSRLD